MRPALFLSAALLTMMLSGATQAAGRLDDPPLKAIDACVDNPSLQKAYDCVMRVKAAADAKLTAEESAWPDTEPMQRANAAFTDYRDAECRAEAMTSLPQSATDFDHLAFYTACQSQFSDDRADRLRLMRSMAKTVR